jgi:hypothetical protein
MFIIEGTYKGKKLPSKACFILSKDYHSKEPELFGGPNDVSIKLKNNLISVDIVADEQATGGGVQGAAGGAVLGFLIAGPIGTVLGAGMGSKKKGRNNTTLAITWANGDVWVVDGVDTKEYAALRTAVATSKPKKITSNSSNKKTKKKISYKDKINIKKPKFPSNSWNLTRKKGKTFKSTTTLPDIAAIKNLQNAEGDPVAIKLFLKLCNKEIEKYNNWKWQYFDLKVETDKEVNIVAQHALKKLIVTSNEASKIKDNTKDLEAEIKEHKDSIEDYKSKIKVKKDELKDAGFFGKGGIKREILNLEYWMKDSKSDFSKAKRGLTSISKKIESTKEIKSLEKGSEEFVLIFGNLFPNEKKPSKALKSKLFFNDEFLWATYKKVFDEIWDKRIDDAINELKEKESIEKEVKKPSTKETQISKKDKLNELKELLDEELITNEEYEESRKKILAQ